VEFRDEKAGEVVGLLVVAAILLYLDWPTFIAYMMNVLK
jgi:hypothetical protein